MKREPTGAHRAATRVERDSMGEVRVPMERLYGASTQRAVENFPVSGRPLSPRLIVAYAVLKRACAEVNHGLGRLDARRRRAIVRACEEIEQALTEGGGGGLTGSPSMADFPVDVFQTGSGTSTNMNLNEVICGLARRAAKAKGAGAPSLHPNDHVNLGQSSNDTFPTAMQVAAAVAIDEGLLPALARLERALRSKARAWSRIVKIGRTHLMDATPLTLGQEISGYAAQIGGARRRARQARDALASNLPIGGTAVGTGQNTHPDFGRRVAARLSKEVGIRFRVAENHFEAQATRDGVVEASGHLRTIAVSLSKIASDLRLLASGPRAGLGELRLPAVQPGSSIMPGKVNPVHCESVVMVACKVMGNDAAIALAGTGGVGSILELNVAMPLVADLLLESIELLARSSEVFSERCVEGMVPERARIAGLVEDSLMLATALVPAIGYDHAADVAKGALAEGKTIRAYARERGVLAPDELARLLDVSAMTGARTSRGRRSADR